MKTLTPHFDETLGMYQSEIIEIAGRKCIVMRVSFVGELGYEIHIPNLSCLPVYRKLLASAPNLKHAGFKALTSLSCEKGKIQIRKQKNKSYNIILFAPGYHLWNSDLKSTDTPIESNLGFLCRKTGNYVGQKVIRQQRKQGVKKQIAYFTLQCDKPLWGYETIWRNGEKVGYLRRGDYAFTLDRNIGVG